MSGPRAVATVPGPPAGGVPELLRVEEKVDRVLIQVNRTLIQVEQVVQLLSSTDPGATAGSFSLPRISHKDGTNVMSALALLDTQMAVDKMIFSQAGAAAAPPPGGSIASDNPAVATASLDPDGATWTVMAVAIGTANVTYSEPTGMVVVPPMVVTVSHAVAPETGDFDPAAAVISNHP